jgi:hypothetical protein
MLLASGISNCCGKMINLNNLSDYREKANKIHHNVVECLEKWVNKLGINCSLKKECDISEADMIDSDLCISIGKLILTRDIYLML